MTIATKVNKDNVLIGLDGSYNDSVHKKLNGIIHNIASNKIKTNPTISLDDLKQESWLRIYEVIDKNLKRGVELEISYLITVAQTTSLGYCQRNAKRLDNIDDFSSMLLSDTDANETQGRVTSNNVAKNKLEYEIVSHRIDEEKEITLRLSFEDLVESIDDVLVRNLIIIKYVKEFDGTSEKIHNMYRNFYQSIEPERRSILDNMDKFTNNAAFRVLGMRATDNASTRIRKSMKDVLAILR